MSAENNDAQPRPRPIGEVAAALGIPDSALLRYGRHKAKVALEHLATLADRPDGRLVLVTAISPTPAGEGKTTTVIGLGDALQRLGTRTALCLREPSMGPVFGMKGGATGGGRAQLMPMDEINLHFTGDFAAIAQAHNLLAALIDNHIHHGNALGFDTRRISWKRVIDMNDRALRHVTVGLGGPANGVVREDGFDIVVASEVMAIFCLAGSLAELRERLGEIVVGTTATREPIRAKQLQAHGAMAALLRDAFAPNLVQTLEHTPAFVHGGPFANIAHGCNSLVATRAALKLADLVLTEAGFGADLGAEKFFDIVCRRAGLAPAAAVLVATVRALKFHGGVAVADLARPDPAAVARGWPNLERHLHNLREHFGLPVVVALNHRHDDAEDEIAVLRERLAAQGAELVVARHFAQGGAGAENLARAVLAACEAKPTRPGRPAGAAAGPDSFASGPSSSGGTPAAPPGLLYADGTPLWDKLRVIATLLYGAADVQAPPAVRAEIERLQAAGHGRLPVCVAKTPYSFSGDAALRGAPTGHVLTVREVRLAAGAGFVVMICGDILTMPGLPRQPAACAIDLDAQGRITGLF